jgi:hypothetical protein
MIIAIYNNNVAAFKYQSTNCEEVDCIVNPDFLNEPIFTESQQYRFYVDNGVVVKKTEEELKAEPAWLEYQKRQRAEAYKKESDALFFKYQRGEIDKKVWEDKVEEIRDRFKYYEVSE